METTEIRQKKKNPGGQIQTNSTASPQQFSALWAPGRSQAGHWAAAQDGRAWPQAAQLSSSSRDSESIRSRSRSSHSFPGPSRSGPSLTVLGEDGRGRVSRTPVCLPLLQRPTHSPCSPATHRKAPLFPTAGVRRKPVHPPPQAQAQGSSEFRAPSMGLGGQHAARSPFGLDPTESGSDWGAFSRNGPCGWGDTYSLCNRSSEEPPPSPSSEFCTCSGSLSSVLSPFWDAASPFTGAERSVGERLMGHSRGLPSGTLQPCLKCMSNMQISRALNPFVSLLPLFHP